jgi:hypothetical protein
MWNPPAELQHPSAKAGSSADAGVSKREEQGNPGIFFPQQCVGKYCSSSIACVNIGCSGCIFVDNASTGTCYA